MLSKQEGVSRKNFFPIKEEEISVGYHGISEVIEESCFKMGGISNHDVRFNMLDATLRQLTVDSNSR